MSVEACVRLAYIASICHSEVHPDTQEIRSCLTAEEQRNIWWEIVVFERYYYLLTSQWNALANELYNNEADFVEGYGRAIACEVKPTQ